MTGLPRAADMARPRDTFDLFVLRPIEICTDMLRRGDAFSEASLWELRAIRNRLQALDAALAEREKGLVE